jgi:flagellar protein FlbD
VIPVSRLQGGPFWVNPDLVLTVEATPDTVVTLTTGDKLLIAETPDEFAARFRDFKRAVYSQSVAV